MVQTRSRAQGRTSLRKAKSISKPNSTNSTQETTPTGEVEEQTEGGSSIGKNSEVNKTSAEDKYVVSTPKEPHTESLLRNLDTDDEDTEDGLGEADKLQLTGIIHPVSYYVPNEIVPIEHYLEQESSDSDAEAATDDDDAFANEEEMESEFIEVVSEGSNKEKKVIQFNDKGQPIGEGSAPFASELGTITRKHCPVSYANWRDVPGHTRNTLWKLVTDKYVIPVAFKRQILEKIHSCWRKYKCLLRAKHYDIYDTDEERKRKCPKGVRQVVWNKFVDNQSTPVAQAQRKMGKMARQAMKNLHVSGRSGAARVAEALKKQNPSGTVTRTELFLALHSRADGSCPTPELTEKVGKIKAIAAENPSSINLDIYHDPVAQVCGPERNGRSVRGMGAGVSKSSLCHAAPATYCLQQERELRIAAEKQLADLGVNVASPEPVETHSSYTSCFQNTPILRKRKSITEPRISAQEVTPSSKKRRGFEDDDADMDYEDEEDAGDVDYEDVGDVPSEDEPETDLMESVADGSNKVKKVIQFNDKGQPVGEGSAPFTSELGSIARKHCPISYNTWHAVPSQTRDVLWKLVTDKYDIPVAYKLKVLERMHLYWKKFKSMLRTKYYDIYNTDEERKRRRPKGVKQDLWNKFVDNQSTPTAQAQRMRGKNARQAMKTIHVTGRSGAARVAEALKKKNPSGNVTRTDLYLAMYSRKDGSCPTPEQAEKVEKIKAIAKENPDSVNLDIDHDPVAQVYGPQRSGQAVRGLGIGVSKVSLLHSAPVMMHLEEERKRRIAIEEQISRLKKQAFEKDRTSHQSAPEKDRGPHHSSPEKDGRSHLFAPEDDRSPNISAPEEDRSPHLSAPEHDRRPHLSGKPKIVIPPMKETHLYSRKKPSTPETVGDTSCSSKSRDPESNGVDLSDNGDQRICVFEEQNGDRREPNLSAEEELAILKQQVVSQKEQIGELQQEREVITDLKKQILSQGLMIADMKELFSRLCS